MPRTRTYLSLAALCLLLACARADHIGKPPSFTEVTSFENPEHVAMLNPGLPLTADAGRPVGLDEHVDPEPLIDQS